jgi:hypothetical protein
VTEDPREVCPLSRREYAFRGEATLYPCHYNTRWLFSLIPRPLSCRLALRSAFPCGRTTALLRSSHESSGWVVPLGRWRGIRDRGTLSPCSWPHTFWFKPISTLCIHAGLSNITAFISTYFKLTLLRTAGPRPPYGAGSRRLGSRSDDRFLRIEVTWSPRLHARVLPIC